MADWAWDARMGTYAAANGTVVSATALRSLVTQLTDATATRLSDLATQRAAGTLDTLGFRSAVQAVLKPAVVAATALAHGGTAQLDHADYGKVGAALRSQYDYLSGLMLDVAGGAVDVTAAGFVARTAMYAGAVHTAYQAALRDEAGDRGDDEEMNDLDAGAQTCDGCQAETDRGWVPLGELIEPGARDCLSNCRCAIITRNAADAAAAA